MQEALTQWPPEAKAPPETLSCPYCGNQNVCVEVRAEDYPGRFGFAVKCGFHKCGARGPVHTSQMTAVALWNEPPARRDERIPI